MIKGTIKFDGIALMEFEVSFVGGQAGTVGPSKFIGKAAFVNSEEGTTHGSTTCLQWSETTLHKLNELRAAMERDLANQHLSNGEVVGPSKGLAASFRVGGIGENLNDDAGVPQT